MLSWFFRKLPQKKRGSPLTPLASAPPSALALAVPPPSNMADVMANSKAKIRQIMVKAHTRPLTMVKYNREGDLLFTTGKDHTPSIYYADNGERIGTYDGHNGTVWCIDVNCALPSQS